MQRGLDAWAAFLFFMKTHVHDLEQEAESPGSSFPIWKTGMIKALATKPGQIVEG